jgi:hypothetical protein
MSGSVTPMWNRPAPQSPSCFSELAQLGQCYNQVQWLTNLLTEIVTDIITTDTAVQQAIVDAIVATGSNVPLIGVTNGSDAQPGQVGEYVQFSNTGITYPAATSNTQVVSLGILQPGDWDCLLYFGTYNFTGGIQLQLSSTPAGFSTDMYGVSISIGTSDDPNSWGGQVFGQPARALISVPSLVAVQLSSNVTNDAAGSSTGGYMLFRARRQR